MNKKSKVDEFMSKLQHPLKEEMKAVIEILRAAGPQMDEDVKWGGPSFDYKEPMATFNPRMTEFVALIFHKGELLQDKSGLLEAAPKGKAYAKFRSMEDVRKYTPGLQKVVKEWIKLMDK